MARTRPLDLHVVDEAAVEFALDDDGLADLKEELLYSHAQQVREEGPGLVWIGTDAEGEKGKWAKGQKGRGTTILSDVRR